MKFFLTMLILVLTSGLLHAEPIPIRGVVEGFYGDPWTHENRLDILEFSSARGFNAYIYAPKDDPYHRNLWREKYPAEKLAELKSLVEKARECNIDLIFAVSPGLDLNFDGKDAEKDRKAMLKKLSTMYKIGFTHFAIFFDDIQEKNPTGQAEFLNWLQKNFVEKHSDIRQLITVPTEYFRPDMHEYTTEFSSQLDQKIMVLYTGEAVVGPALSDEDFQTARKIYPQLGIWWNYPVNDYIESKLALGAVENLPRESKIPAIFFNPMNQTQLSKISLATAADYSLDPKNYSPMDSWNRALEDQFGFLSDSMKIFADHSQHLENSWANCGAEDGQRFKTLTDQILNDIDSEKNLDESFSNAFSEVEKMITATRNLQRYLPKKYLDECSPQLEQFRRIAEADRLALELLRSYSHGNKKLVRFYSNELQIKFRDIENHESTAMISEKSAVEFIRRVIDFSDQL